MTSLLSRTGYFYENQNKKSRQFFTMGAGIKYNIFGLNFSYLIPSGSGEAEPAVKYDSFQSCI
jgi:hypothetical protein